MSKLGHLPSVHEVTGSIPVRDSDFFFVPCLSHVDQFTFQILLPSLKFTINQQTVQRQLRRGLSLNMKRCALNSGTALYKILSHGIFGMNCQLQFYLFCHDVSQADISPMLVYLLCKQNSSHLFILVSIKRTYSLR